MFRSKVWHCNAYLNQALPAAKEYAYEALQYLVSWGIVSKLTIDPLYIARNVIHLKISISGAGISGQADANASWLWQEYRTVRR